MGFEPTQAYASGASAQSKIRVSSRSILSIRNRCHSNVPSDMHVISGKSDGLVVYWPDLKKDYIKWKQSKGVSKDQIKDYVSALDRKLGDYEIRTPMDVVELFRKVGNTKKFNEAFRNLLTFLEDVMGYPADFIRRLRKAVPKKKTGEDARVIEVEDVTETLLILRDRGRLDYYTVYYVILASGLRATEVIKVIREFDEKLLRRISDNVFAYPLLWKRGFKLSFYAWLDGYAVELIRRMAGEDIDADNFSRYIDRYGKANPKYLRKLVENKLIELGCPESVTDYILGHKPKTISKNYIWYYEQAKHFYPRYAEWLKQNILNKI